MRSNRVHSLRGKHVPQRTCIICRRVQPKRELLRLVCTSNSEVEVDPTGKMRGRGAYICRQGGCWHQALRGNRLEYALKTRLTPQGRERLNRYSHEPLAQ